MRFIPRISGILGTVRGFSLVELSVVVAIISVVATLGLEAAASFVNRTSTSVSRDRMKVVDDAVANFFKVYGRLPCPAVRTQDPTVSTYGFEDCTIGVVTGTSTLGGGGIIVGGVPFRNLNLPMMYALDGFNSKLNYVVTKNLTVAGGNATVLNRFGSTGGTNDTNGVAGIEVRTGVLAEPCTTNCQKVAVAGSTSSPGAAYLIFSSGADQRGAVSDRGATLKTCTRTSAVSDKRVDSQNCVFGDNTIRGYMNVGGVASTIGYNVFYDNRYNAGLNLSSYFDDVVIWRTKAQL